MFSRGLSRSLRFPGAVALRLTINNTNSRHLDLSGGRRCIHVSKVVLSTPPPMVKFSELSMETYHELSDATMDTLLESLENLLDDIGEQDYEVEYSSGVLTLNLADKGTYVINKQPPNKQIWLSSPFSGPKRYDYSVNEMGWYYSRDGQSIGGLLEGELSEALGRTVTLGLDKVPS